ncbi:MAG TPA: ATP-binding protein [Vicinamibacterales bacterium]|nr:ATP-binding protein [Vicinamibacterales bacterium]
MTSPDPAGPTWFPGDSTDERLRELLTLFGGAMKGVFYAFRRTPDGRINVPFMAPSMEAIWGSFGGHDLTTDAQPIFDRIHPDDRSKVMAAMQASATSMTRFQQTLRVDHPDKGEVWLAASSTPTRQADGAIVWFGYVQDITDRIRLEERMVQAERVAALSQLTGGIAHDFNNLLTVIIGNSEMLLASLADDHRDRLFLDDILQAGRRAASLTQRLLTFTRRHVSTPEVLHLSGAIGRLEPMLDRILREDVTLRTALDAPATLVRIDPSQLELLLVNLVVNARDATAAGGTVTIATREADADAMRLRFPDLPARRFVELSMTDTGAGMTPDVQARLFEPFFTTKAPGQGTGLGLATVFGIVQQAGGAIAVDSAPGAGSTFRIYLPVVDSTTLAGTE